MIKRVIIFVAVLAALLSPGTAANAAIIYSNLDDSVTQTGGFGATGALGSRKFTGQSFTIAAPVTALQMTNVRLRSLIGVPVDTVNMVLMGDDAGEPDDIIIATSVESTTVVLRSCSDDLPEATFTFNNLNLSPATYWIVAARDSGVATNTSEHFGICITPQAFAPEMIAQFRFNAWEIQNFTIFGVLDGAFAAVDEILVPVDLSTVTATPFDVSGTCDSATQNQLEVEITEVGAPLNTIDRQFVTCEISDTWDVGTMGAAAWNADFTVTLYDIVEGTFGTRVLPALDEITVTVDVMGNTNEPPPVIDAGATDDDFGFLGDLIRDVLIFLFVPSAEALDRFANLFDLIASKPPIGFITAAVAAFGDLEEGTPVETLEGTATLSAYFDPIRTAISAFLFLLFGLYLINRLSRISI